MLYTYTKTLGTYALTIDNKEPTIKPLNFKNGQWLSNFRYLKLKIDDEISGVSNYRATVNGKWILMEYDYKTKTLTHDFNDGAITNTKITTHFAPFCSCVLVWAVLFKVCRFSSLFDAKVFH